VWPVSGHLTETVLAKEDGEFYLWLGWRIGELLEHGSSPLVVPDVVAPYGYHLVYGDGLGAYLVLGLTNVLASPVLALNLVIVAALFANALAGRHLATACGADHRSTLMVTALALASAPSIVIRSPVHFHFLFAFVGALVVAEAVLFARQEVPVRFVRVGVLLGVAFYVSFYWFASSLIAFLVIVTIAMLRQPGRFRSAVRVFGCLVVAALLVSPLLAERAALESREARAGADFSWLERSRRYDSLRYSADLLSVVVPPAGTRIEPPLADVVQRSFAGNRYEATIFPGFLMLAATLCFAITRGPLRFPVLAAMAILWIFSLGPALHIGGIIRFEAMPTRLLQASPGMDALRTPSRLALALPILAAVALAVVAERIARFQLPKLQRTAIAAVAGALLLTNLVRPATTPGELDPELGQALRAIRDDAAPPDAVVEVPFDPWETVHTIRMQMLHRLPTLGFHAQWSALPWFSDMREYKTSRALAALRCDPHLLWIASLPFPRTLRPAGNELAELQRQFGVRYLFVREERLEDDPCDRRRREIEQVLRSARVRARADGWRILEIPSTTTQ
jgi:hypothetical protein